MTNTIPNVPRELLAELQEHIDCHRDAVLWGKVCDLLSAPSPAGVYSSDPLACTGCASGCFRCASPAGADGCRCSMSISVLGDGCRYCQPQEYIDRLSEMLDEERAELSDATAIIGGLRGEVADLRSMLATVSKAGLRGRTERDQQAQRIGELEGLLEHASKYIAPGAVLTLIKSTLSAGKEGE